MRCAHRLDCAGKLLKFLHLQVQAFNLAGSSPFSKVARQSTNALPPVKKAEVAEELPATAVIEVSEEIKHENEDIVKYLIVGGSLAGTFFTLIILCFVLDRCRQYNKMTLPSATMQPANTATGANPGVVVDIQSKFNDTAISNHQSFSNLDSRHALASRSTQSFLTKDSAINSSSTCNFEMSLLPNGGPEDSSRRNYICSASDSMYSSNCSLGQEEYSAEPKSWRRSRRRSEDITEGFI